MEITWNESASVNDPLLTIEQSTDMRWKKMNFHLKVTPPWSWNATHRFSLKNEISVAKAKSRLRNQEF